MVFVLLQPVFSFYTSVYPEDECGDTREVFYTVTATVYHSDPRQCDADYTITADGSEIDTTNPSKHRWIAVSRDMLIRHGGMLDFGDTIMIEGTNSHLDGVHTVRDVMNKRYRKCIDFLVSKNDIYGKWEGVKVAKI